jgi:hypothetical protein
MPSGPERALRREITRLALLDPADLSSVLSALPLDHRLRTESLLADYITPPVNNSDLALVPTWVRERIDGTVPGLTPGARAALAECSERHRPHDAQKPVEKEGKSLLDQTMAALFPVRRTR